MSIAVTMHVEAAMESVPPVSPPSSASTTPSNNTSFAFLVHSQDSFSTNSPPNIDNKSLVRQRRRRTSPEDHAILEVEFVKNPRPDRETRKSIVERVSLGDKEVHIWFQNRRQKVRRRATPLNLAEASLSSRGASVEATTSFNRLFSSDFLESSETLDENVTQESALSSLPSEAIPESMVDSIPEELHINNKKNARTVFITNTDEATAQIRHTEPIALGAQYDGASDYIVESQTEGNTGCIHDCPTTSSSDDFVPCYEPPSQAASLSSRKDIRDSSPTGMVHHGLPDSAVGRTSAPQPTNPSIRLSFDSSGAALLLEAKEPTPSPPRSQPLAPTPFATRQTLRRSYSAAGLSDFRASVRSAASYPSSTSSPQNSANINPTGQANRAIPLLLRNPSGRSRDSRAWEFWCDTSARSAHADNAERESKGSAANAISLMRSRSSGGLNSRRWVVPTPALSRGNSTQAAESTSENRDVKRLKTEGAHAPVLKRPAATPLSAQDGSWIVREDCVSPHKAVGAANRVTSPTSESDKENREPGARARARLGPNPKQRRRPALLENRIAPPLGRGRSMLGREMLDDGSDGPGLGIEIVGNRQPPRASSVCPEDDEEVARFMGGSKARSEQNGDENENDDEMAVLGLMSLSQGNWR